MKTVYARQGCAGFVFGESSDDGCASFCARCKRNRTSHTRRLRIVDGGKHEEGAPMSAISEASEIASERRRAAVSVATKALQLSDAGGAVWMTVSDAGRWRELVALVQPARVKLIGNWDRVCESFTAHVGDLVVHASGPTWTPSAAEFERMLDEREEG